MTCMKWPAAAGGYTASRSAPTAACSLLTGGRVTSCSPVRKYSSSNPGDPIHYEFNLGKVEQAD